MLPTVGETLPGLMAESPGSRVLRTEDLSPKRSGMSKTPSGLREIRFLNHEF